LKRAALALGFHELLEGVAAIFERECSVLPGSAHPVSNELGIYCRPCTGGPRYPRSFYLRILLFTFEKMG
jgi:hypothetical protein